MPKRPQSLSTLIREQRPELAAQSNRDEHRRRASDPIQREADRLRSSSRWQRLRASFLARNPLCAECERSGVTRAASVVDHVVPIRECLRLGSPDPFDAANLQALCSSCDDAKSARERAR